jgi:hypothetical protein
LSVPRTNSAQKCADFLCPKVKFPKTIRHRRIEATIYRRKPNYPFYRVAYYVAGKRQISNFKTYAKALAEAERKVREISDGSRLFPNSSAGCSIATGGIGTTSLKCVMRCRLTPDPPSFAHR